MKVLFLNQTFYPDPVATAQHSLDLAMFLKDHGCDVSVFSSRRSYNDPRKKYPAREYYNGIKIFRILPTGFGKRNTISRLIDALSFEWLLVWNLLWFSHQDIVISFTSPPLIGLFGLLFCKVRGGDSVQWLMDINPDCAIQVGYLKKGSWIAKVLTNILEFCLKKSTHLVVLDRWMKKKVMAHGATENQILIVPPWTLDEERILSPTIQKDGFRKKFGLENKFLILYSGNHSIVHPLDTLLETAVQLRAHDEILFLFIGAGLRVTDVKEAVKKNNLRNVVQLPYQPREDLNQSLLSANLHVVVMGNSVSGLVHTSKIYGVLYSGRPYVFLGPKESHVGDILAECPFGFQVDHGDVESLIRVIHKVKSLTQEELRIFETKNKEYAHSNFSGKKSMRLFVEKALKVPVPDEAIRKPFPPVQAIQ